VRGKVDGEMGMRCWNLRCEIALLCGALAGTLSPANDADEASQPMNEIR